MCGCKYTPEKKPHSYDAEFRQKAIQLYVDGMNLRRIGRHLGVHHQSVANWAKAHAERLPAAPVPDQVENAEMDELFTFIGDKKNRIYIITIVDRKTRCILGWIVVWERTQAAIEQDLQTHADIDLEAQVDTYLADLQAGMEALKGTQPQTPEERHQLFGLKKRIVDLLLTEAIIDENREIHIKVRVNLLEIAGDDAGSEQKVWIPLDETGRLAQESFQANEIVAIL
jgi:hypothetical protein